MKSLKKKWKLQDENKFRNDTKIDLKKERNQLDKMKNKKK